VSARSFDVVVLGAGPAGQKAAVQAAKAGRSVILVEREAGVGGECVRRGTIPSKTLRETAAFLAGLRDRGGAELVAELGPETKVKSLMGRLDAVLRAHETYQGQQMARNGIEVVRGVARFTGLHDVAVGCLDGSEVELRGQVIVVATGSRPRSPDGIDVDHERVLDSDSILDLLYLPRSLTVLGGGVIAAEFASIFQTLGVAVTMIDRGPRPVGFLDPELTERFLESFETAGGRFLPGRRAVAVRTDEPGAVVAELDDGSQVRAEKVLVALGRVAALDGLGLDRVGLAPSERGFLAVDPNGRTAVPHVWAVGDVVGPPALAASAMEQGRRAMCAALGLPLPSGADHTPIGIYTIPEMASVGLDEATATKTHGSVLVGRAPFSEVARGHIAGSSRGLLKLIADAEGRAILGTQVVGEGATELVHVAQMALVGGLTVEALVENIFNFPTLAEAYRVAALDVLGQVAQRQRAAS
jgi:NAD(P) transhydrogenase